MLRAEFLQKGFLIELSLALLLFLIMANEKKDEELIITPSELDEKEEEEKLKTAHPESNYTLEKVPKQNQFFSRSASKPSSNTSVPNTGEGLPRIAYFLLAGKRQ
jgi:hypothetical protein